MKENEVDITENHFNETLKAKERIIPAWCKRAAIIGFWRQGAMIVTIARIMGILP